MKGKKDYSSEIVQHSISDKGVELVTFRLHYPRFIHAEMLRHRALSRNVSSSRAIPIKEVIENVKSNPASPVFWGKNKAGMQAIEEINSKISLNGVDYNNEDAWIEAAKIVAEISSEFEKAGYHKQIVNRLMEPFIFVNEVVSGTDFDNFFYLRLDNNAQPEIQHITSLMFEDLSKSVPFELKYGEWHVPYIFRRRDAVGGIEYLYEYNGSPSVISLKSAIKISSSACAQASYRKLDLSLAKANDIYNKLITSRPIHASAYEHCATPFSDTEWYVRTTCKYILKQIPDSHYESFMYKGNYKGWTQYRKLLNEDTCYNFEKS
jgi:hypothetical protein